MTVTLNDGSKLKVKTKMEKEKMVKKAVNLLYCKSTIKVTIFGWAMFEEPKTVISMKNFQT